MPILYFHKSSFSFLRSTQSHDSFCIMKINFITKIKPSNYHQSDASLKRSFELRRNLKRRRVP